MADITYIQLRKRFVYLAAILDAWSRKVVGYALGTTMETTLTLEEIYNQRRLHSALGYLPPDEFEQLHARHLVNS